MSTEINNQTRSDRGVNCYNQGEFEIAADVNDQSGLSTTTPQFARIHGPEHINPTDRPLAVRIEQIQNTGQRIYAGPLASELEESIEYYKTQDVDGTDNSHKPFQVRTIRGRYTYRVQLRDRAGNKFETPLFKLWVDRTPPPLSTQHRQHQTKAFPDVPDTENVGLDNDLMYSTFDVAEAWQNEKRDERWLFKAHRTTSTLPSPTEKYNVEQMTPAFVLHDRLGTGDAANFLAAILRDHAGNFTKSESGSIAAKIINLIGVHPQPVFHPSPGTMGSRFSPTVLNVPPSFRENPEQPFRFVSTRMEQFELNIAPKTYYNFFTSGYNLPLYRQLFFLKSFMHFTQTPIDPNADPYGYDTLHLTEGTISATRPNLGYYYNWAPGVEFDLKKVDPGIFGLAEYSSPLHTNTAIKITPDIVATGNVVTFRVSAGYLGLNNLTEFFFKNKPKLDPTKYDYIRFVLKDGGDVTGDPAETNAEVRATKITLLKNSDGALQQTLIFDQNDPSLLQHLELTVEIGSKVPAKLCHVDVNLGHVKAYPDEIYPQVSPANTAYHRMNEGLALLGTEAITRDDEDGSIRPVDSVTYKSNPIPTVKLTVLSTSISDAGDLKVEMKIDVRDQLSELAANATSQLQSLKIIVNGVLKEEIGYLPSFSRTGSDGLFRPTVFEPVVNRTLNLERVKSKSYVIHVETAANAAGFSSRPRTLGLHPISRQERCNFPMTIPMEHASFPSSCPWIVWRARCQGISSQSSFAWMARYWKTRTTVA